MVNEYQLAEIIKRIEQNTATEEDLRIYNAWCNAVQEQGNGIELSAARQKELLRAINHKIDGGAGNRRWLYAAAAILVAVFIAGMYIYSGKTAIIPGGVAVNQTKEQVVQDKSMGTLLLADGRKIALTTDRTLKLAGATGVEIIQTSDSTLEYKVAGNSTIGADIAYNTLSTTADRQMRVQLSDGTKIWLNAGTSLKFPVNFNGLEERSVELEGEAYFDVMHNERAPFIIKSGTVKTTVLGTAFNIKAYKDAKKITVSVVRGKVRVEDRKNKATILTPNQQVTYNTVLPKTPVVEKADAAIYALGWHQQELVFEDQSFKAVADLLSSRYETTIQFKNPDLAKCIIKASFKASQSIDDILTALCLISNATYTKDGTVIVLDGEGCGK